MKKRNFILIFIAIFLIVSGAPAQPETVELGGGAKIVNKSFEEKNAERMFEITADYPEITGLDSPNARKFNELARARVMKEIDEFRESMLEMDAEELKFVRERGFPNYSEFGYSISTANERIISASFGNAYYAGGAHPNTQSFTLNFDLKNGRQLQLEDLFLPNSNYLKVISDYAVAQLEKDLESPEDEWVRRGAGADAENFRSWTLGADGLRINFDAYQVAPYVAGPQEVTIPFDELRGILRVFDFPPLAYANSGNPVNWCRSGLFPKDGDDFRIANITGGRDERIFFYKDDAENCPQGENCKTKSYVIPNDEVIVSRTYAGFACAWFQPEKANETVGWIALDKLEFVESSQAAVPWIGDWTFYDNSINIAPGKSEGKMKITGNAFWRGLGDNIHIGEIDFSGIPENNKLSLGDEGEYECRVKMRRAGKYLIVSDNLNCGGANVTFNGIYKRK